jgi:hypothetical protein
MEQFLFLFSDVKVDNITLHFQLFSSFCLPSGVCHRFGMGPGDLQANFVALFVSELLLCLQYNASANCCYLVCSY